MVLGGVISIVVFALGHFGGFLAAAWKARSDPGMRDLTSAMRAHVEPVMGFRPSILDFREYFSASFSLLLLTLATVAWLSATRSVDPVRQAATVAPVVAAGFLVLAVVSAAFRVPQGLISSLFIAACFFMAWRALD